MSRVQAVVVAAGSAMRLGGEIPKQFRDLGGTSVVARSIAAVAGARGIDGVIVVVAPGEVGSPRGRWLAALPAVRTVVAGGATRMLSVLAGVTASDAEVVLVHDAARPFVTAPVIQAVLDATLRHGAAVPALAIGDTIKRDDGRGFVAATVDRAALRFAQTPQGARRETLRAALERAIAEGVETTDEAHALERAGVPVALVPGDPGNVKITTPEDWTAAEARVRAPGSFDLRVGHGYDVHRFGSDRTLVLGGVRFDGERGLLGHSDADVVLHAAMDALLGAAGLADIGHRFPPGDPQFAGADSAVLAADVAGAIRDRGLAIGNLDLTVLAEAPRIGPRVPAMREAIGRALGIDPSRIGLKATTLEGLGSLGRGEGIACHAVALLHGRGERA